MRIDIQTEIADLIGEPTVGNAYSVRGGSGAKNGHISVIVAITQTNMAVVLTVNRDGDVITASAYGLHYFRDKCPIGFVEGIEELSLVMRSIK